MRPPDARAGAHLSPDRLAACEAGQGTLPERMHLRGCAPCREEMAAIGRVVGLAEAWRDAPEEPLGAPPLTQWETLAPALRREGLLRESAARPRGSRLRGSRLRASRLHGSRLRASRAAVARWGAALVAVAAAALVWVGGGAVRPDAPAAAESPRRMVAAEAGEGEVLPWEGDPARFEGVPDPDDALARTRARLAALDRLLAASEAALASAPGDPVLLRSVQSAHAAREAALRQLDGTLPASHQLVRF